MPAGNCQLSDDWSTLRLLKVEKVSSDTKVFTFATPDETKPLNLPTCACLLASGGADAEGNPFVRPYTPVSTNARVGEFDLMVKIYPQGNLSQFMDKMKPGDTLDFKHIKFNVKRQYPFEFDHLGMLVGGTGITPMIQALHAVLGNPEDSTNVTMLYGSQRSDQILCEQILMDWQNDFPERLKVIHVMSNEPEKTKGIVRTTLRYVRKLLGSFPGIKPPAGSSWDGQKGFITKELIESNFPGPSENTNIFVCGPPPMYDALCGARDQEKLTGVLADLGYAKEQVTKF